MASALQQMDGPREAGTTFDLPFVAVSVIVPVAERCEDLHEIYWAHAKVLRRAERFFEFIFVLDGGFEGEAPGLESLVALGEPIRIVTILVFSQKPRKLFEQECALVERVFAKIRTTDLAGMIEHRRKVDSVAGDRCNRSAIDGTGQFS